MALITIATLILIGFLWAISSALLLVFAAFLVAVALDGLGRLLQRLLPISRHLAVIVTSAALAIGLGAAFALGSMNVVAQAPQLQKQVSQSIDQISAQFKSYQVAQNLLDEAGGDATQSGSSANKLSTQLTHELSDAASLTVTTLTDFFLIVIIGLYLALDPRLYQKGLVRLFPPDQRQRVADIGNEATNAVRRWLTGRFVSMTVVGVVSAIGLAVIGIPFALLLGLIAGLLTFVPYLGAIVSAVPALLVAGLHGYNALIYVAVLYLSLHIVEGYVLAPLIQKRAVSIAPGFLLIAQTLGGAIAGLLGIALATPIALVIAVIVQLAYVRDVIGEEPHLPGAEG
ncbi:AI-2E family transporter [Salinisphaera aquimarina]|uniref:AI-2E family transporter n=1 Tax=Salinisphaera aquimarina TaxID=2094031 RepID=A0ABV7ETF1_9GAMM